MGSPILQRLRAVPPVLACLAALLLAPHSRAELAVPDVADLTRIDQFTRPEPQDAVTATYILRTWPHATLGEAYVIVTDHNEPAYLGALDKLAAFHRGSVLQVADLGALRGSSAERAGLAAELLRRRPRFVALAPKAGSFTENMLLGFWSVLGTLGSDQQLPVFPGILAAPDAEAFQALVRRSIAYHPQARGDIRPFAMAQVLGPRPYGMRSLQKVRILGQVFGRWGRPVNSLVVLEASAVRLGVEVSLELGQWKTAATTDGPVSSIPSEARPALDAATLLVLFGHGSPGTECSLRVSAFRDVPMAGKIVMSGDCYSAAPLLQARGSPGNAPDSALAIDPESFAMLAARNGAVVVYAHMHENQGFPFLYPVLENCLNGLTVGEAYQRLINAILALRHQVPRQLAAPDRSTPERPGDDANDLLYIIIGDPALQPFAGLAPEAPAR